MDEIQEIKEEALKTWSDLAGIVLFGSYTKNKKYHDIDILIVLENIEKSRIERV